MGGWGSGGHNHKGRPSVEECIYLDISKLEDFGALKKGAMGTVSWGKNSMGYHTKWEDMIVFRWVSGGVEHDQFVGWQWWAHKRHFGGHQKYLLCQFCHSVRQKLYFYRGRFACRACHRIPYASQRLRSEDRAQLSAGRLFKKLGCHFDFEMGDYIPERPKWMRIKTYNQICDRIRGWQGALRTALNKYYQGIEILEKLGR